MKEIKNYKNIRKKAYLYGFDKIPFFVFVASFVVALLTFLGGFSLMKVIFVCTFIGVSYLLCRNIFSNEKLLNSFLDNKLPKKYSDYE